MDVLQNGISADRRQQGRIVHVDRAVAVAREHGSKIETESINVHLRYPIPQALDDHRAHRAVGAMQGVARARPICIDRGAFAIGQVIGAVVDSFEAVGRPRFISFAGVVVDDIQDHLDARCVQGLHELPKFVRGTVVV